MEQRFETFTWLIADISRCVQKIENAEMATHGCRGSQVQCLFALHNADNGANLTALCEICGEDKGMMSRTLKALVDKGLVYVDEQKNQKYRNPYKLTEKGKEVADFVSGRIGEVLTSVSKGVNEQDRENMYRTLAQICENLNQICHNYKA